MIVLNGLGLFDRTGSAGQYAQDAAEQKAAPGGTTATFSTGGGRRAAGQASRKTTRDAGARYAQSAGRRAGRGRGREDCYVNEVGTRVCGPDAVAERDRREAERLRQNEEQRTLQRDCLSYLTVYESQRNVLRKARRDANARCDREYRGRIAQADRVARTGPFELSKSTQERCGRLDWGNDSRKCARALRSVAQTMRTGCKRVATEGYANDLRYAFNGCNHSVGRRGCGRGIACTQAALDATRAERGTWGTAAPGGGFFDIWGRRRGAPEEAAQPTGGTPSVDTGAGEAAANVGVDPSTLGVDPSTGGGEDRGLAWQTPPVSDWVPGGETDETQPEEDLPPPEDRTKLYLLVGGAALLAVVAGVALTKKKDRAA